MTFLSPPIVGVKKVKIALVKCVAGEVDGGKVVGDGSDGVYEGGKAVHLGHWGNILEKRGIPAAGWR